MREEGKDCANLRKIEPALRMLGTNLGGQHQQRGGRAALGEGGGGARDGKPEDRHPVEGLAHPALPKELDVPPTDEKRIQHRRAGRCGQSDRGLSHVSERQVRDKGARGKQQVLAAALRQGTAPGQRDGNRLHALRDKRSGLGHLGPVRGRQALGLAP